MGRLVGVVGAVLLLLTGCAAGTLLTRRASWPRLEGALGGQDLGAPVRIVRDGVGIPHVRAASEEGAWYGLGFVHAQDRLFQADLNRRLAFGGVAELFGEAMLELDGFLRGLALEARARESFEVLPQDTQRALGAYAQGMNAGVKSLGALPVEYRLMDARWKPWQPHDALAILYLNSWFLAMNPLQELHAFLLREKLDHPTADLLLRTDEDAPELDAYWEALRGVQVGPFTEGFRALMSTLSLGDPSASNNWVVSGARTADGKPIVANDPHLVQQVPSVWYAVDVAGGALHVAGGTMPGFPFVLIGHNERLAWGFTNVLADYIDFAVLERQGEGYILEGEVRPFEVREVEVALPGGRKALRRTLWTEVGPVVTGEEAPSVLAMRWSAFELLDHSAETVRRLNLATSVQESHEGGNLPATANQNVVMADVDGNIGWAVSGVVPKRRRHTGRVPYLASRPGEGWAGWEAELPRVLNPERGYWQTANSRPDHPLADTISSTFIPAWRHDRIGARLSELERATPEEMHALQRDVLDTRAQARLPGLLEGVAPKTRPGRQCLSILKDWDYVASETAVGPTVWAMLHRQLVTDALGDVLGEAGLVHYFGMHMFHESFIDRGLEVLIPDRAAAVGRALDRTCPALQARYGDPKHWTWGRVHALALAHPFAAESALLSSWSMETIPWSGTTSTVNQSGFDLDGEDWSSSWIASLRMVTPLSDPGRATIVYPGGQSGHPGHPHYRDLFDLWKKGETHPLWFHDTDVEAHAKDVLVLTP